MQESIIRARLAEAQHTADRDSSAVLMRRQLRYEERDCRRTLINDAAVRARFSCNRRRSLDVVEVDHVALSDDEAAQGYALACQLRPKTDLVVAIAASSGVCKTRAQTYRTRLHSVERLSETAIAFSLERSETFTFLPGQYVNVLVPGTDERRSYSCSSPPGAETLSFLVRNIPPGVMSSYLRDKAVPGTPVEFIGPAGASICVRSNARCCSWREAPASRRSYLCWENQRDGERAPDPTGIRRHQRCRPCGHRAAG